jgi:pimeloyl-ACP methyl ester carboxylesterase
VDLYLKKEIFLHYFANDLPTEDATRLWATQRSASTSAFETPSQFAAWETIPSWYFISSGDQIITPTSERAMAERARSHITEFDGGSHLTLISHPDAVTAVIQQAIDSVRQ